MESRMVPEHPTESFGNVDFSQDQFVCADAETKDTVVETKKSLSSGAIFDAKSSLESFAGVLSYDGYQNAVSKAFSSVSAPSEEQDAFSVTSTEPVTQQLTFAFLPNLQISVAKKSANSDATMESNAVCFGPSSVICSTEDQHPHEMMSYSSLQNHSNVLPMSVSVAIEGANMPNALVVPCISVPDSVSTAAPVDFTSSCVNIENMNSSCSHLTSSSPGLPFTESICTSGLQATFSAGDSDPTYTTEQKNTKLELLTERLAVAPAMSAGHEPDFHVQSSSKKSWLVPAPAVSPSSALFTLQSSRASGSAKRKSAIFKKFAKEHSTSQNSILPSISAESMHIDQQPGRVLEVGDHPSDDDDHANGFELLRPAASKLQCLSQNSLASRAHAQPTEVLPTMDLNSLNPAASCYSERTGAFPSNVGATSKTVSINSEAALTASASPSSSFSEQCRATAILGPRTGRDKLQTHGVVLDSSTKSSVCPTPCFSAESKLSAAEKPTGFVPNLERKQVLSSCLVEAKSILDCGIGADGRKYYQVLWVHHSWETESHIVESLKDLVDTYWTVTGVEAKRHLDAIQQSVSASEFQKRPEISRISDQALDKNSSCSFGVNALAGEAPVILYRVSKELQEKTKLASEPLSSGGYDVDRGSVASIEGQLPSKAVRVSGSKVAIDKARKPKSNERPPKEFNLAANVLPPSQPVVASALGKDITKTERRISCQICQRAFGNDRSYRRHKEYYSRTHRCPICFDVLCSSRLLQQHLRLHLRKLCCRHSFQLSSFVTGVRTGTVARRIRKRKLARPKPDVRSCNFKCGSCERAFFHIWDLQRHKTRARVDNDRRLYECDRCKKRFRSVLNLGLHKELHQDVKIKCGGCDVRFASQKDFDGHDCTTWRSLVYTCVHGDLPYRKLSSVPAFRGERSREKCEKCKKNLYAKLARTVHKCQTLQRCSPCFACVFGFRSKSELSKHVRFHEGRHEAEKLNQGVSVATGHKPFRCIFCRAIYRNSRKLRGHIHVCLTGLQGGVVHSSTSNTARCLLQEDAHSNREGYIRENKTILPDFFIDQSKSFDEAIIIRRLIEELVSCVAASVDCFPLDAFVPANMESFQAGAALELEVGSVLFEITQEVERRHRLRNSFEDNRHASAGVESEPSATCSPAFLLFADSRPAVTEGGGPFDHQSAVLETVESMLDVITKRSALAVEISAVLAKMPRPKFVYKCKLCCRLFPKKFLLLSHLQKHQNTNAQACCSKCGLSGYSPRYLRKCIRDARATIRRRFSCFLCASLGRNKEETFSLKNLVRHFASHKSKMKCWTYCPVTLVDGDAGKAVVLWFRLADKALFQDGVTCEVPQFGYFYVTLLSDRSSPSLFVEKLLDFQIPDPDLQTSVAAQAYFTAAMSDSERNKLVAPASKRVSLTLVAWKRSVMPASTHASPAGEGASIISDIAASRRLSSMRDGLQPDVVVSKDVSAATGNALCVPSWIVMHRSLSRSRETASVADVVVDDSDDILQRFDRWQVSLESGIRCCKCSASLHSEQQMILHFYEQHGERTTRLAVCHLCSTSFKQLTDLDEHIQKAHAQCELCRDHLPDAFTREMHNDSAHKNIVHFCPDCASPFLTPGLYLRHRRLVHGDVDKSDGDLISSAIERAPDFDCKLCGVPVTNLCDHFHLHPSFSTVECYVCAETFASQYLFARHLNLVHRMPWTAREIVLMSDWVSSKLQNVLENIVHGASRDGDEGAFTLEDGKGFGCHACHLRFASSKTLEFHVPHVCSRSLLVCSYCDLHFFDKVDLESHIAQEHGSVESLQRKAIVLRDQDVISAVESSCMRSTPCSSSQPTCPLDVDVLDNEEELKRHKLEVSSSQVCPDDASDDSMLTGLVPVEQHKQTDAQLSSSEINSENLPHIRASGDKVRDARAASSFVECYYCAMLADSSPTMLAHYRDAHCLGASEIAALPARNLVEHRPVPDPKLCKNCKKQFALDRSLWRHMFEHLRVEIHKCFICRKTFARRFDLKRHISQEHNVLFCDYCYKGFHCFVDYERHVRLHVLELNIPRDISGKMIVELDSYSDSHEDIPLPPADIDTHVPKKIPRNVVEDERLFHCIVCDKNIEGELTFIVHMKTHAEPRRLTCIVCMKTFGEVENLRIHLQNHLMRPRSGSECSSDAVDNSIFQEESVMDETPDKCLVCSSVFDSRDDLKSHEACFPALKPDNERKIFEHAERIAEQLFVYEMLKTAPHSRPGRGDVDVRECVVGRWEAEWRIADELGLEKLHKLRVEVLAKETLEKLKGPKSKESGSLRLKRKSKIEKLPCPFCYAEQLFQDRESLERHVLKVHACAYCHVAFADDAQLKMHTGSHLTGFSAESKFVVCLYCCKARPKQGFLEHLMREHRLVYASDAHLDEAGRFRWPESSLGRSTARPELLGCVSTPVVKIVSERKKRHEALDLVSLELDANVRKKLNMQSIVLLEDAMSPCSQEKNGSGSLARVVEEIIAGSSSLSCPVCAWQFPSGVELRQHVLKHVLHPSKEFGSTSREAVCVVCNNVYRKTSMKTHILVMHGKEHERHQLGLLVTKGDHSRKSSVSLAASLSSSQVSDAVAGKTVKEYHRTAGAGAFSRRGSLATVKSHKSVAFDSEDASGASVRSKRADVISLSAPRKIKTVSEAFGASFRLGRKPGRTVIISKRVNAKKYSHHGSSSPDAKKIPAAQRIAKHIPDPASQLVPYPYECIICAKGFFTLTQHLSHFQTRHPLMYAMEKEKHKRHKADLSRTAEKLPSISNAVISPRSSQRSIEKVSKKTARDYDFTSHPRRRGRPRLSSPQASKRKGSHNNEEEHSIPVNSLAQSALKQQSSSLLSKDLPVADGQKRSSTDGHGSSPRKPSDRRSLTRIVTSEAGSAQELYSPNVPGKLKCAHCNAMFRSQIELDSHMTVHEEKKERFFSVPYPYVCIWCARGFYTTGLLKSHMQRHHAGAYTEGVERTTIVINRAPGIEQDYERGTAKVAETFAQKPLLAPNRYKRSVVETSQEDAVAGRLSSSEPKRRKLDSDNSLPSREVRHFKGRRRTVSDNTAVVPRKLVKSRASVDSKVIARRKSSRASKKENSRVDVNTRLKQTHRRDRHASESIRPGESSSSAPEDEQDSSEEVDLDDSLVNDDKEIADVAGVFPNEATCKYCNVVLNSEPDKRTHESKHFEKGATSMQCLYCASLIQQSAELIRHVQEVHGHDSSIKLLRSPSRHLCEKCNRYYKKKDAFMTHLRLEHSELMKIECRLCDQRFFTKGEYSEHYAATHGKSIDEEAITCLICDKAYESLELLHQHYSIIHMKKDAKLHCALCNKYFRREAEYDEHRSEYHKNDRFSCGLCMLDFEEVKQCEEHVMTHKVATDFQCLLCSFYFPSEQVLTSHVSSHEDGHELKCAICGEGFSNVALFQAHKAQHGEQKLAQTCISCDKSFASGDELLAHMQEHQIPIQKTYKCSSCDETFLNLDGIQEHMEREHQGGSSQEIRKELEDSSRDEVNDEKEVENKAELVDADRPEGLGSVSTMNRCDLCKEMFVHPEIFREHMLKHEKCHGDGDVE